MLMRFVSRRSICIALALGTTAAWAANPGKKAHDPSPELLDPKSESADKAMRPPADEIAAIEIQSGYHLELVASEPDIISPVICAWDGNGRMYVAEMRTYMLDIDGSHEHDPISRVSRWESTKGDGVYDKHSVFVDKMILPRMILPLDDRVLIRETDTKDIFCYRDTKGTGVADEKKLFYEGGKAGGNLEHQASGLLMNIDNWIYTSVENTRYRIKDGKMQTERLGSGQMGQWGLTFDDTGRTFCNTGGGENPGWGFQVSPVYGDIRLHGEQGEGFNTVYPKIRLTDVQGGPGRLAAGGGLNHFTACAGPSIYRGDALPSDLEGDYLIPEPAGRLIRRAKVTNHDGQLTLTNAYDKTEFIRSMDPNFRPVWTATGPDGCLYICDLYHGIIQESNWTKENSYLRPQIQKYGLDKNINGGRIYRLVHDGAKRRAAPHMLDEKPAELVAHLADPNGWWRDTAQKLIVLRGDKSVVPQLIEMAKNNTNPLARLHALWTLEGLDAIEPALLADKINDADFRVRSAVVRIAEPFLKKNDTTVLPAVTKAATDTDPNVVIQFCMSMIHAQPNGTDVYVHAALDANTAKPAVAAIVKGYHEAAQKELVSNALGKQLMKQDPKLAASWLKGRELFQQTCIACHGPDGKGAQVPGAAVGVTLAPPLKGSKRLMGNKELTLRIVLHGLEGPNDGGKVYLGAMAGFKFVDDEWIANAVTYVRNDFGNHAPAITPGDVKKVREETIKRDKPFTLLELQGLKLPDEGEEKPVRVGKGK